MTDQSNKDHETGRLERLKELVTRAVALPRGEREAFIVYECAGDVRLAFEVRDMVAAHDAAGSFMNSPTHSIVSAAGDATTEQPGSREGAGNRIGAYKLLELIGEGGFGSVYLAEQREPVARRVALKIIKSGMDSRMVAARFEAERQALALMEHPHIARVFDGGVTDASLGARPYFVMEYVKGDPITAFADAHKLSVAERLSLFTQVCQAVQHAHTKGVIHRDLKPSNVLVSMTDGKPFAKVIDFGIAKSLASRLTEKTLFTEHRQLIGTPEYMSPEQAEGSPDIDTRTDVYALGVLLYELLTGATPFDAARLRSAAFAEMQRIIREEEPPTPSVRLTRDVRALAATAAARQAEPGRLGTQIKGELDWIVMKALDKDRARRYESPNQLAADVSRHLAGEAVVAAPVSVGYRVRKFVRRNRGAVVASSAVGGALLLGMGATTWQWREATTANRVVRERNDAAEWSAYTANLALAQAAMEGGNWPEARQRIEACPVGKRGWEWEFLKGKSESVIAQFPANAKLSSDGNFVVGWDSGVARVWDAAGKPLGQPMIDDEWITDVAFDLGNSQLFTQSLAGAQWWDMEGRRVGPFIPMAIRNDQAWISADGGHWLSLERAGTFALRARSGTVLRSVRTSRHTWPIFSCDNEHFILSDEGLTLHSVSGDPPRPLWRGLVAHNVSFSPDCRRVLFNEGDGTLHVLELDGTETMGPYRHDSWLRAAQFSTDNRSVLTADRYGRIRLWDAAEARVRVLVEPPDWRHSASLSSDGASVLSQSNHDLCLIGLDGQPHGAWGVWEGIVSRAQFTPDGRAVFCSIWRSDETRLYSLLIPTPMRCADRMFGTQRPTALLVRAELEDLGGLAASGPERPSVSVPEHILSRAHAWFPDGSRVVIADEDNTVRFVDPIAWREIVAIRMPAAVMKLTFTRDGTRLISELADGSARVWDTRSADAQAADTKRRWGERGAAMEYLDKVLESSVPTDGLQATVEKDESIGSLRRAVASEMLAVRVQEFYDASSKAYEQLTKGQTDAAKVRALARESDLPTRAKEMLIRDADRWQYHAPPTDARLADEIKQRRLSQADLLFERNNSADDARSCLETRGELLGGADERTLAAAYRVADWLYRVNRPDEGLRGWEEAVEDYHRNNGKPTLTSIVIEGSLAQAMLSADRFEDALRHFDRVLNDVDLVGDLPASRTEFMLKCEPPFDCGYSSGGTLNLEPGKREAYVRGLIQEARQNAYRGIARREYDKGQYREAIVAIEQAEEIRRRLVDIEMPPASPGSWRRIGPLGGHGNYELAMLAQIHFKSGDLDKAREKLAHLRALMADPTNAETWAKDTDATALLKEAEKLIESRE